MPRHESKNEFGDVSLFHFVNSIFPLLSTHMKYTLQSKNMPHVLGLFLDQGLCKYFLTGVKEHTVFGSFVIICWHFAHPLQPVWFFPKISWEAVPINLKRNL